MDGKIKVTVWNEFRHEKTLDGARDIYPDGIHACIKSFLDEAGCEVRLAALDDPGQGLPDSVLNDTDVLIWWGHMAHEEVDDGLVERIKNRVFNYGMGFIGLHSSHMSKPFRAIVGTSGNLLWGDEQKEIVWNIMPSHPIAKGIPEHFVLESEEMYGEPFMIPQPDAVCSPHGSSTETSSETAAASSADWERFSTSSPDTRPAAASTTKTSEE